MSVYVIQKVPKGIQLYGWGMWLAHRVRVELYNYQSFYAGLRYSKACSAQEEDEEMKLLPAHMAPKAAVL